MDSKEKFQETFGKLHADRKIIDQVLNQTKESQMLHRKRRVPKVAAAAIAVLLVFGTATTAYAMDLGGLQRTVQLWIHGDQTEAVFSVTDGSYDLEYTDENGESVHQGGGGVALNEDGTERPLSEEELWDEINSPDVEYEEDGRVWLYFQNQKMDITDKFKDGICYVKLEADGQTWYLTVKYENGYAMSSHAFVQPWEFN